MLTSVLCPATLRLRRASSTFPWLGRLALPSGSTALTQDERFRRYHRGLIYCKVKWDIVLSRAFSFSFVELQLLYHPHTRRHLFYCSTWTVLPGCYTQVSHRSTLYQQRPKATGKSTTLSARQEMHHRIALMSFLCRFPSWAYAWRWCRCCHLLVSL